MKASQMFYGLLLLSALLLAVLVVRLPEDKDWVELLAALLTPTIAVAAVVLGVLQYRLALKRRDDELFDRRYRFFDEFRKALIDIVRDVGGDNIDADKLEITLASLSRRAEFLFPAQVSEEIRSLSREIVEAWVLLSWSANDDVVTEIFLPHMRYRP